MLMLCVTHSNSTGLRDYKCCAYAVPTMCPNDNDDPTLYIIISPSSPSIKCFLYIHGV